MPRCVTAGKVEGCYSLLGCSRLLSCRVGSLRRIYCVVADTSAPVLGVWWLAQRAFAVIQTWL
ncbi:hypothetical protein KCP75_23875 [Salmonella enterica subsp. enterica]|nr:hypothetical protein KCP75_23875 [Salmonella enterica subsp. enterica]